MLNFEFVVSGAYGGQVNFILLILKLIERSEAFTETFKIYLLGKFTFRGNLSFWKFIFPKWSSFEQEIYK